MTDEQNLSQPPETQKALHYRLTREEWLSVSKDLRFAELRVLYYLRTLDPFGDRQLDLKIVDVAATTGLTKGTVSKALQALAHKEYIDLELIAVRVRVNSAKKFPVGNLFPTGNLQVLQETSKSCRKLTDDSRSLESTQGNSSENNECTNNRLVQTLKRTSGASTTDRTEGNLVHPKSPSLERHPQDPLLEQISNAGVNPNKTIQQAIATLKQQLPPAAVVRAVENAISSLQEQRAKGVVRNPGGFLVAALRRNFTANGAKRNAREGREKRTNDTPRASPPQRFDEIAVSQQIDTYLRDGRRDWAIAKAVSARSDTLSFHDTQSH